MRVVLAPDKFAGTLSAGEVCAALSGGWRSVREYDELVATPLSDGGPGFVEVIHAARGGELHRVPVRDPLGRPVDADLLIDPDGTAWVESAQACGLHLLARQERDPERTSTHGVGDLLLAALAGLPRRVVVGVGGTATNDGGRGLLEVLPEWPPEVALELATDVDNPLLGINGASAVFGPQKGADPSMVQRLDAALSAWVAELGAGAIAGQPGAGAGGGLGFALLRLGGRRVSGVEVVLAAVDLAGALEGADLVVTGEGSYDATSLRGKVVSGVAAAALGAGVPCVVVAGQVSVGRREMATAGVDSAYSLTELAGSREAALSAAAHWVEAAGARLAEQWGR